jgi:hypothetical protein
MSIILRAVRTGLPLVVLCAAAPCVRGSPFLQQQPAGKSEMQSGVQTRSDSSSDFEVKIIPGKEFLVRRKGTLDWTPTSKLSEPITVGFLDGDRKIYLGPTKALKPPKGKHMQDPDYPQSQRQSGQQGRVALHIVVDDQGVVRFPTVDAKPILAPQRTPSSRHTLRPRQRPAQFSTGESLDH